MKNQKRILIAYGSRYGCTEEISRKIAKNLEINKGYNITLLNLKTQKLWDSHDDFDGVIVGTSIRIGKWTKETKSFLRMCTNAKKSNKPIIGVFVSCGYASDPKYYPIAMQNFLLDTLDEIGVKSFVNIYDVFGGVFDFSKTSNLSRIDKKILKYGARDLCMTINHNERNDYRDWGIIDNFSSEFASLIAQTE